MLGESVARFCMQSTSASELGSGWKRAPYVCPLWPICVFDIFVPPGSRKSVGGLAWQLGSIAVHSGTMWGLVFCQQESCFLNNNRCCLMIQDTWLSDYLEKFQMLRAHFSKIKTQHVFDIIRGCHTLGMLPEARPKQPCSWWPCKVFWWHWPSKVPQHDMALMGFISSFRPGHATTFHFPLDFYN